MLHLRRCKDFVVLGIFGVAFVRALLPSLWSAVARGPKEYTWPSNWWIIFMYPTFWNFDWKFFLLGILSIQCKIRRDRTIVNWLSTGQCDRPVGHPWSISAFTIHFFWLEFWTFYLKFYTVNEKTVWICSVCKLRLLYFILQSTLRVTKSVFFILPIDWMLELFCH